MASLVAYSGVAVVDVELSAVRLWVNVAGLARDLPSLHAALLGSRVHLGPLVSPPARDRGTCAGGSVRWRARTTSRLRWRTRRRSTFPSTLRAGTM